MTERQFNIWVTQEQRLKALGPRISKHWNLTTPQAADQNPCFMSWWNEAGLNLGPEYIPTQVSYLEGSTLLQVMVANRVFQLVRDGNMTHEMARKIIGNNKESMHSFATRLIEYKRAFFHSTYSGRKERKRLRTLREEAEECWSMNFMNALVKAWIARKTGARDEIDDTS